MVLIIYNRDVENEPLVSKHFWNFLFLLQETTEALRAD
jgi:hypothetical protein